MSDLPSSPPGAPPDQSQDGQMDDVQELPILLNTAPPRAQFNFQSSDPIGLNFAPQPSAASGTNRKRAATPGALEPRKRTQALGSQGHTPQSAILEARDLIVLASTLTNSRDEQTRLLDLLSIFREYTEKGSLFKASTIITSQIANLESATRQLASKTRDLNRVQPAVPTPRASTNQSTNPTTSKPSYATTAKSNQPASSEPQEWTNIGPKGPIKTPKTQGPRKPTQENRIILVQENPLPRGPIPGFSPLSVRNAFNKAFYDKGIKDLVVATVYRSISGNIVVATTSIFNADFLLDKKSI
jgi:hypothetical protein